VGPLIALVILAEVGDMSRFGSARKLASWAGLTPTVRGSDRTIRHGHISKQGSPWLRWALAEAAQNAKRHTQFTASYAALARRRGTKIATTAIARKLLTRAWHLLTDAERTTPPIAARHRGRGGAGGNLGDQHRAAGPARAGVAGERRCPGRPAFWLCAGRSGGGAGQHDGRGTAAGAGRRQ
jgi:Transposase IS116/IS110/IS902 family